MNYEELFTRIDAFKQLKLQKEIVYALSEEDGAMRYVCAGPHGAWVFPTKQALNAFFYLRVADKGPEMWDDSMLQQDCIQLRLTDRDQMDREDYALIKALERSYRGRGQWPQLRRLRPYCLPWRLSPEDCALLGRALEAVSILPCAQNGVLAVVDARGGVTLSPEQEIAPKLPPAEPVKLRDEMLIARLKRLPRKDGKWDVTLQAFPFPAGDEAGGTPYFPMMLMAVDEKSDTVLHVGVESCKEADGMEKLVLGFLAEVIRHGARPTQLMCANKRAQDVLGDLFDELGVTAMLEAHLPQLEEAFVSLMNFSADE